MFEVDVTSPIVWNSVQRVGAEQYLLTLTEEPGDASHLFVFQQLPGAFCSAGAWETAFGGNGVETRVSGGWLAPNGRWLLLLLRSTGLSRGYRFDEKSGVPCPSSDDGVNDDPPGQCHVMPSYSAYFNVLSVVVREHVRA